LVYTPRIPDADVDTTIDAGTCTTDKKQGQRSETYQLDENEGVQIPRVIDTEDLIRFCQANSTYLEETLLSMMDACVRKMDKIIAADAIALSGNFGAGETGVTDGVKSIRTRKTGSSDLDYNFIEEIDFAAENAGYCGAPAIFGYSELYKAYKVLRASNCCADNGTNIAQLNDLTGSLFIPNRNITTAFGSSNNALMVDLGALQVLTYNRYIEDGGVMTINDATTKRTVITHPTLGIPFDFKADYSCGKWHIFVSLAFKTVGMPDDLYFASDIYNGVVGVNKLVVANS
jgi:hypothetical protein